MPAPEGNKNAVGNKGGGRRSSYRPEYADQARKLCSTGFTDQNLANFFGVTERTINNWKLDHVEFLSALELGKEIADAAVERAAFLATTGYTRKVQKVASGEIIETEEYFPPNGGVAMRWLACRKPEVYRERREETRKVDVGEAFLKLLEHVETEGKKNRERDRQLLIDRYNAIDTESEVVGT